jgi:hypothetical protein
MKPFYHRLFRRLYRVSRAVAAAERGVMSTRIVRRNSREMRARGGHCEKG